jgi:hypothetical protein|tara:strand:+ start:216 stop:386 length:171 start_codon:yes stop_codon:yes gene_type:complete
LTSVKINLKLKNINESLNDLFCLKQKGSWKWLNVEKRRKKVRRKKVKKEEDKLYPF